MPLAKIFRTVITMIIFLRHIKVEDEENEITRREEKKPGAGLGMRNGSLENVTIHHAAAKQSGRLIHR